MQGIFIRLCLRTHRYLTDFTKNSLFDPCEKDGIETGDESLDFNAYYKNVSTSIVNIIQEKLSEFLNVSAEDVMIVYDGLQSPKYYNYRNDVIACTYYVSPLFVDSVLSYLHDNTEALQKYLTKHFESRSGFISDFTTDVGWWIETFKTFKTSKFTEVDGFSTVFGSVLDFLLNNEKFDEIALYYEVGDTGALDVPLKEEL